MKHLGCETQQHSVVVQNETCTELLEDPMCLFVFLWLYCMSRTNTTAADTDKTGTTTKGQVRFPLSDLSFPKSVCLMRAVIVILYRGFFHRNPCAPHKQSADVYMTQHFHLLISPAHPPICPSSIFTPTPLYPSPLLPLLLHTSISMCSSWFLPSLPPFPHYPPP